MFQYYKCNNCNNKQEWDIEKYKIKKNNYDCDKCNEINLSDYIELPTDNNKFIYSKLQIYENKVNDCFNSITQLIPLDENNINDKYITDYILLKRLQYIISYNCWKYTYPIKNNDVIFKKFYANPTEINKKIRNNIFISDIKYISNLINNAPKILNDIILYRGINEKLNLNVGDEYIHKGFMFCTSQHNIAKYYTKNTSSYYDKKNYNDITKEQYNGIIFIINIKYPISLLDTSLYVYEFPGICWSECILDTNLKFIITDIKDNNIYLELK